VRFTLLLLLREVTLLEVLELAEPVELREFLELLTDTTETLVGLKGVRTVWKFRRPKPWSGETHENSSANSGDRNMKSSFNGLSNFEALNAKESELLAAGIVWSTAWSSKACESSSLAYKLTTEASASSSCRVSKLR